MEGTLQDALDLESDEFDEDLFDFDELLDESEPTLVQLDEPAEHLPSDAPPPVVPARPPAAGGAASVLHSSPAPRAPAAAPSRPSQVFRAASIGVAEVPPAPEPAARASAMPRGELRLVLVLAALFNVVLIAFAWRSLSSVQALVVQMGDRVIQTTDQIRAETAERAEEIARSALPVVAPRPEGLATLDNARAAMQRGEFERARQMLYALLAVADRIEPAVRRDIEARASFLIADSFRLQADFVPPPAEEPR